MVKMAEGKNNTSDGRSGEDGETIRMKRKFYLAACAHLDYVCNPENDVDYAGIPLSKIRTCGGNSILHLWLGREFKDEPCLGEDIVNVLQYDGALIKAANDRGECPHHIAAKYGQHIALQTLVEKGDETDDDILDWVTKEGDTALHLAIRKEQVETVQYLVHILKSEKMKVANQHGEYPLHMAVLTLNYDLVEALVKKDTSLITLQDLENKNALHHAVRIRNERILMLLLKNVSEKDLEMKDHQGKTVGHIAAEENDLGALRAFIGKGAKDLLELRDVNSQNVVHCAAAKGCGEVLEYFYKSKDYAIWCLLDAKDVL